MSTLIRAFGATAKLPVDGGKGVRGTVRPLGPSLQRATGLWTTRPERGLLSGNAVLTRLPASGLAPLLPPSDGGDAECRGSHRRDGGSTNMC